MGQIDEKRNKKPTIGWEEIRKVFELTKKDLSKIAEEYDPELAEAIKNFDTNEFDIINVPGFAGQLCIGLMCGGFISVSPSVVQVLASHYLNINKPANPEIGRSNYLRALYVVLHELIHFHRRIKLPSSAKDTLYLEELVTEAASRTMIFEKYPSEFSKAYSYKMGEIREIDEKIGNLEKKLKTNNTSEERIRREILYLRRKKVAYLAHLKGIEVASYLVNLPKEERIKNVRRLIYAKEIEEISGILEKTREYSSKQNILNNHLNSS